jgi:hypothetical protein
LNVFAHASGSACLNPRITANRPARRE